jgi:RNA-directed DNA polymerase
MEQLSLFEQVGSVIRPVDFGEAGSGSETNEEQQAFTAMDQQRALTQNLMERVVLPSNLNAAYKRVKANKGSAGIDGMTVDQLSPWLAKHKGQLIEQLVTGSYTPWPIRGVQIGKPTGGVRQLGIPTVIDRFVEQAILQVLEPLLDSTFSASSHGFRPLRSAHTALKQAQGHVAAGYEVVVDIDLEKFFDRVNHDVLMSRLYRWIGDKRLLRIIRRFLEAGLLQQGVKIRRVEGTPQGGPLSPLLANLLLDDLDKELERRGHRFCRYADDCNIYVRSKRAGERVMHSITGFLENELRLRVNQEKSAVAHVQERKFLGYQLLSEGRLGIAPASLERVKARIRQITRRNRGVSIAKVIGELNEYLTGWVTYFRHAQCRKRLRQLDQWLRRKLRCYRLKQRKRTKSIADFLMEQGVPEWRAWLLALSGKGWWRMSGTPQAHEAMPIQWFQETELINLTDRYLLLSIEGNRPVRKTYARWCDRGRS